LESNFISLNQPEFNYFPNTLSDLNVIKKSKFNRNSDISNFFAKSVDVDNLCIRKKSEFNKNMLPNSENNQIIFIDKESDSLVLMIKNNYSFDDKDKIIKESEEKNTKEDVKTENLIKTLFLCNGHKLIDENIKNIKANFNLNITDNKSKKSYNEFDKNNYLYKYLKKSKSLTNVSCSFNRQYNLHINNNADLKKKYDNFFLANKQVNLFMESQILKEFIKKNQLSKNPLVSFNSNNNDENS